MSQANYVIGANLSGLSYRTADNAALAAIVTNHSGASAPSYVTAGMIWLNTAATPWLLKMYDGTDHITLGEVNSSTNTFLPYHGAAGLRMLNHATDTGSANAYAIAPSPAITAYSTGQIVTLKPANANTGASTINVNSLGAKSIKLANGQDPSANAMITTGVYLLMYDGTNFILLNPEFMGRQTIWVPATAMVSRTTNGAASGTAEMTTNKNMVKTLDFDASTQEFAQFEIGMPKDWDLGTITFEPVWSHASTATNFGVVWALQAVARSNDDALDVAFGTEQASTDTGGTTNDLYVGPESAAITVGGTPAAMDVVQFQIKRNPSDASDTLAIDARLHGVRIFYTTKAGTDA